MQRHARLITMVASVCLSLVFIALFVCMLWAATTIKRAAARTLSAVTLSERYELLERQLSAEAALVRVHGFDPEASGWNEERPASILTSATIETISEAGDAHDREIAHATNVDHDHYLDVLLILFSQIDNNAPDVTATFKHSLRISERMLGRIDARAAEKRKVSVTALADLASTQAFIVRIITLAFVLGVVLLTVSLSVILTYRHRIEKGRKTELERLAQASLTDILTGLGNHRAYQQDLERELARVDRHGGTLTLALIDVDNFKAVNDSRGHIHGDQVLTALGELLRGLRKIDRSFRLGGDEFGVVLPHTNADDALAIMERLRQSAPEFLHGATLSIGISSSDDSGLHAVSLRAQADSALYAAKRLGRNTVINYRDARIHSLVHSTEKECAVRQLIDDGCLDIVFQPIWDVTSHALLGFEALARPPEKYGLCGPQEAFDVAEQIGLAPALDALSLSAIFKRAGELPADALLFINIVPETLDSQLVASENLLRSVALAGLTPERVVVELTERSMLRVDMIVREAKRLQSIGFRLALDDTGAGNAGLDVLRRLSVDFVKIDRLVVIQAMSDPIARAIVAGVVDIARAMGAYVIAEGIETLEALSFICCDVMRPAHNGFAVGGVQGYLLGRPEKSPNLAGYSKASNLLTRARDNQQIPAVS